MASQFGQLVGPKFREIPLSPKKKQLYLVVVHTCNPALERVKQEDDHEFWTTMGYSVRSCLKP